MRIDDLINNLHYVKERYGNLEVTVKKWDLFWEEYHQSSVDDVEVITEMNQDKTQIINLKI